LGLRRPGGKVRNFSRRDWPPKVPGADWLAPPDPFAEFRRPGGKRGKRHEQRRRKSRVLRLPAPPLARAVVIISVYLLALLALFALVVLALQLQP
jgi:hypothetical protein